MKKQILITILVITYLSVACSIIENLIPCRASDSSVDGHSLDAADGSPTDVVFVDNGGKVGIGTKNPDDKLEVSGDMMTLDSGPGGDITGIRIRENDDMRWTFLYKTWDAADKLYIRDEVGGQDVMTFEPTTGNVGIGTTEPREILHVKSSGYMGKFESTSSGNVFLKIGNADTDMHLGIGAAASTDNVPYIWTVSSNFMIGNDGDPTLFVRGMRSGKVGIGTAKPSRKLTIRGGNLLIEKDDGTALVELGEGLDYAEGFDVTAKEDISPGSVLIIDPDNHGKLTISDKPYDSKVAGIVSGANNCGSAVRVGGQFDYDVALAGRVYCNVDAIETGVEPGDLLTTSTTPGYAMKAIDYDRAHGAILGKAMEKLEKGMKGQILVLVTLQ